MRIFILVVAIAAGLTAFGRTAEPSAARPVESAPALPAFTAPAALHSPSPAEATPILVEVRRRVLWRILHPLNGRVQARAAAAVRCGVIRHLVGRRCRCH